MIFYSTDETKEAYLDELLNLLIDIYITSISTEGEKEDE